jgi:phosphoribulokinase
MAHRSPRPALCAVVGAPGVGKRTICRGLADLLGGDAVTSLALDDYLAYDHASARRHDASPLAADAAHLDLMAQHLRLLRQGETVFKPVYDRTNGRVADPEFLRPARIVLAQGMHGLDTPELRALWDVSLVVDAGRADDASERFIAPQREKADAALRVQVAPDGHEWTAELRLAHPVPLPALDELQHDPVATPYLRVERASSGADVIEISGSVDDVSRRHMEARLLAALPDAPPRRQLRLGVIPNAASGDGRSNLLALTQLIVAHYVVQKGRLHPSTTLGAARSAHPAPGA